MNKTLQGAGCCLNTIMHKVWSSMHIFVKSHILYIVTVWGSSFSVIVENYIEWITLSLLQCTSYYAILYYELYKRLLSLIDIRPFKELMYYANSLQIFSIHHQENKQDYFQDYFLCSPFSSNPSQCRTRYPNRQRFA